MESFPEEVAVDTSYSSSSSTGTKRTRAFPSSPPPLPPGNIEEEEQEVDTANCLILLAQGRTESEKFTSRRRFTVTAPGAKAGFYAYECKTCNKCFPSFQALGGHRASHKKPKLLGPTNSIVATTSETSTDHHDPVLDRNSTEDGGRTSSLARSSVPAAAGNGGARVHECSICGSEYASGQALGGHMRRHRPVGPTAAVVVVAPTIAEEKKGMMSLDLNLPAPPEENMGFAFADQRPMALVDCHY